MYGLNLSLSEFSGDGSDGKRERALTKDVLHPIGWNWTYVTVPVTCHTIKGAMENPIWQRLEVVFSKIANREYLNKLQLIGRMGVPLVGIPGGELARSCIL